MFFANSLTPKIARNYNFLGWGGFCGPFPNRRMGDAVFWMHGAESVVKFTCPLNSPTFAGALSFKEEK
jgi:hypothetical protein